MIEPLLQAERLLLHGMVDQAEELFRRTAEQDPRNAIAVVGLARVALERGDDELALAHARAALEIDPENVAAIRLEVRLTEVLAARAEGGAGAPAPEPPRWTSSAPPAAPTALPSEQTTFVRNPSMAEHQQQTKADSGPRAPQEAGAAADRTERRSGLLERLFGRGRRG